MAADFAVEVPGASGAPGGSPPAVEVASFTADGKGVELALDRALAAGETATVSYTWPRSGEGRWDTAGNQFDSFTGVTVKNDNAPAADLPVLSVSDGTAAEGRPWSSRCRCRRRAPAR